MKGSKRYKNNLVVQAAGTIPMQFGYYPTTEYVEVAGTKEISVQMKQGVSGEGSVEIYLASHDDNFILDATQTDDSIYVLEHNVNLVKLVAAGTVSATNFLDVTLTVK